MKLAIILLAVCAAVVVLADPQIDEEWNRHKLRLGGRLFSENQEKEYKDRFFAAKNRIESHNARFRERKVKYSMTLNEYSHLSPAEFRKYRTGKRPVKTPGQKYVRSGLRGPLPQSMDLRNLTTSVKNQGGCGSSYCFSPAAQIEGLMIKYQGLYKNLSTQQILDCSILYGNGGCDGGDEGLVFQYLIGNKGIQDWESYPYEYDAGQCRFQRSKVQAKIKAYKRFREVSATDLKELLYNQGTPICVGMFADQYTLGDYYEGVYDFPKCPNQTQDLNHAVLLCGYGVEDGVPYWLIKNSWGPYWGLKGFFKISQEHDCGVTKDISYAILG